MYQVVLNIISWFEPFFILSEGCLVLVLVFGNMSQVLRSRPKMSDFKRF